MAGQLILNNVTTKLTAQLLVAGVTANVTAGSGALFAGATGGNYIRATLVRISGFKEVAWEIVYVTARSTDALTITRAQEGTTALQFEVDDRLEVRMTAKTRADVTGVWCGTAGGTANALTLTPATPILAYEAGMSFIAMSSASANTSATTVAISGLGTIAVQSAGAACVGGEIPASKLVMFTLDSTTTAQVARFTEAGVYAALAGNAALAFAMATAAQGTNTTQGASTAFALAEFGHHDNLCLNGGFTINQTGYVSAATLAAGSYGHDQWKAGASGGDYSFTQLASNTQITIAANKTLIQIIEASHVQFTSYWLVWEGTAQARYAVNSSTPAGSYAASPIQITGQTVGTKFSIEFNAGTLGKVELSNTPHTNERMPEQELALCQRYFWREKASSAYYLFSLCWTADTNTAYAIGRHPVPMYATPTLIQDGTASDYGIYTNSGYVCSAVPVINSSTNAVQFLISLTFAGTLTANQVGFFRSNNNTNAYIGFEARLT